MIAPCKDDGKSFVQAKLAGKWVEKAVETDHELVKRTIITPNFGQSPDMLGWEKGTVASRPGPVMSTGFLSPPAPRGSAGRVV
jgi:hypothetical protein